ncbi:hypothetical protein BOX15_Mlig002755g2 [Macrostomum lignano]|uniref:Uncharacterized protein n=1 Tax=Macrostomum lignano TaxID=282301 RepID=A0A267ED20_9PLAT|nr:hypothetical protein BOX15_Mlig002755g2 [Macrostomum lignano]
MATNRYAVGHVSKRLVSAFATTTKTTAATTTTATEATAECSRSASLLLRRGDGLATTPTPPLTAASQDGGYSADDSESGVGVGGVCQRLLAASPPSTRERYRLVVGLEASGTASELGKNITGVAIATRGAATATESGANTTTWRRLKSSAGNRLASWRALSEIARVPPTMATSLRLDNNKDFCLDKDCTEEAANVVSPWSERAQYSGTLLELFQRSRRRNSSRDGSHGSLLSVAAAAAAAATAAASSSASSTPADRQSVACQFPPAAGLSAHLRRQRAGGGPLPSGLGFLGDPLPPPPPPPPPPGDTSDSGIDTPGAAAASSSCSTVVCRKCGCRQRPLKSCLLGGGGGGNVGGAGDEADVDSSSSSSSESVIDADIAAAAAAADNDAAAAAADDGAGSNGGFRAKKSVSFCDRPPSAPTSAPTSRRSTSRKNSAAGLSTATANASTSTSKSKIRRPLSLQLNDLTLMLYRNRLVYTAATATVRLCCSTARRRNRRVLLAKNRIDNACRLSSATQSVALTTCCWRSPLAATRSQPRPAGSAHRCTAC